MKKQNFETDKRILDAEDKRFYIHQIQKIDDGNLWDAITKYDSSQISVKAVVELDNIVTGMSTYNVYDLLKIWDELHEDSDL